MGKAAKWFRGLLGLKNPNSIPTPNHPHIKPKKKWSLAKSHKDSHHNGVVSVAENENEASKHAIAVAAATAAVAEAAVAAAQAAAAVVKLTSNGRSTCSGNDVNATACVGQSGERYGRREVWAAVMIQSHFRAYLSRRALRALKALVKLQALVRGYLVRKHTAYALRQLQALVRAQARARSGRALISESPHSSLKSSHFNYLGPATPEKFEHVIRARNMKHEHLMTLKRNGSKSNSGVSFTRTLPRDDEITDRILEVDSGNPHFIPKHKRNLFHSSHFSLSADQNCSTSKDSTARNSVLSPSCGEVQSLAQDVDQSPGFYSASSIGSKRGTLFTPTKSDGLRSCLSGYTDHPNYMAYTESSKAKARSLSAPKQRPIHYERSSSTKRYSVHGYDESKSSTQRVSALHANFANKAYPGSGRLDRMGMPVRGGVGGFSGGLQWHRY
ncbi:hypothetical protein BUALT_Bualt10G0040200 [Buddleja alternifolia]|uniref:DUF4005 domain-containing protein n=1 Tax=Buddleja alternifolia TaxID=168488 RepID=A0AAV6X4J9_9LAMI|nr:hypothetical protein BUALT_Bualt10G0040200 [Buddleja alternifolia]